ncbi:MAG: beta-lactamase family protein, partial [Clostridia bacterium]|nr:beta-lactamase family protein [Clostridia bacterium]
NKKIPSISYVLVDADDIVCLDHVQEGGTSWVGRGDLNENTLFRVGSCSKMFTALALMQLVERGLVDLDTDVSVYIPGFCPENPFVPRGEGRAGQITLRKLLSHTSGLVREPGIGHYLDNSNPPLAATVDSIKRIPLKHDPNAGVFRYSNAGFAVVGFVVELVSKQGFAAHLEESILNPIGMHSSSFVLTPEIRSRLAAAYMWSIQGDFPAPVFDLGGAPAGNLYASLLDMAEFVKFLIRGGCTSTGLAIIKPA